MSWIFLPRQRPPPPGLLRPPAPDVLGLPDPASLCSAMPVLFCFSPVQGWKLRHHLGTGHSESCPLPTHLLLWHLPASAWLAVLSLQWLSVETSVWSSPALPCCWTGFCVMELRSTASGSDFSQRICALLKPAVYFPLQRGFSVPILSTPRVWCRVSGRMLAP